jgi:selenocysteine lyase/cysteine desulfurase
MSSHESAQPESSRSSEGAFTLARGRFPALERLAYLNSGSYGLLGDSVRAAFDEYLDLRVRVGADWDAWVERSLSVRGKLAQLLNAQPDEIAVTASASAGINAVASALGFSVERNRILVSNYEFPTSGQIWHAQERRGAVVSHVAEDESGRIPVQHFADLVDERTRIVVLSHVCFRHGGKFSDEDIKAIVELAHRNGAHVILDVFQSIGGQPVDADALGVDFIVGGMFKYLLGTAGIGFLYVRRGLIEQLVPTTSGWFAQQQMGSMDIFANDPSRTAARFQGGTPPVPSCYAADAGLAMILEYDPRQIAARIRELTGYALEQVSAEGFKLATPQERGPMLAIRAKDAPALVQKLIERDVVTSHRDGNVRAGFHFYNDREDVDRLVAGLSENRPLLA